ncbi:reverse transcriptase domain-containing protein [Tanacetum coccineum]
MARTPLNEHCSAVILNKLPEKLRDPGKFLIPCDFPDMESACLGQDLGASINLMPLSVWKKLSLPKLTPTCMSLELTDRSNTQPIGIAEDVYLKVGKFKFSADFVVVVFDADPRVPLILGRSFLNTGRALIDVYKGELTLRVGKKPDSDFLLEEVDAFLALEDDPTSPKVDDSYYDPEGDILLLESFLNDALDDGAFLVKRCGYFFLNWSSRSHVNSGPLLEFHRTLTNGIRLRFNRLTSRPTISTGWTHGMYYELCLALQEARALTQHSQADFPQLDSGLAVPTFQQGEDPVECINKAMAFLSVVTSRLPPLNNQLRTGIATTSRGNYVGGQPRVMKCYNCQGEGHMTRQCTQPKKPRNAAWFKEKLMLVEAQEASFQTEDLDAYDSDCDDLSLAKAVLMANLSSYDSDVLSEESQDAVRILQKSQENGQNRTNTNTGMDKVYKSREFLAKKALNIRFTPKHRNRTALSKDGTVLLLRLLERLLSASKLPLSFWAEAVATACYTQNRSIIISPTHGKMAYHIINDRKPSISYLYIFWASFLRNKRRQYNDNSDPSPQDKMLFPSAGEDILSLSKVRISLQSYT